MKKLTLISATTVILLFEGWIAASAVFLGWIPTPAPANANPYIEVIPLEHDFGDVELGTSSTTIVSDNRLRQLG
jgi:hypothetical protein